jgi:cytochrome c oxidase cbb3-type subunit 3
MARGISLYLLLIFLTFHISYGQNFEDEMLRSGKILFQVNCSRCHGMLGKGGTGSDLSRPYLPRASTDEKLAQVISNGIQGTAMPSMWVLTAHEVKKIVRYVRHIGQGNEEVVTGNAQNGKVLFANSICTTCHIVSGEGGSLGPELTKIGLKRGQEYLAQAIAHPGKSKPVDENGFYKFLVVSIKLKSGELIKGIRINEDSFSIQIRDAANFLHSYHKEDILSIRKIEDESLMPGFSDQFSDSDINDIVAYLTTLQ